MLGSLAATFGSLVVGGAVAAVTVVGVVNSQTSPPDKSPVSVSSSPDELIPYGAN